MFWPRRAALGAAAMITCAVTASAADFGRKADPAEISLWDIDVRPDGKGLPAGQGSVSHGHEVYDENCAACHGDLGQGGFADRLVGGQGSLTSAAPVKTVGSFWPYATTLFDYVRRAMPYSAPQTLSADDTYAVVAYILYLNGVVPEGATLDASSLPAVTMPNRNGFVPDREFTVFHNARQARSSAP